MRTVLSIGLLLAFSEVVAAATLQNEYAQVNVDPAQGGAVTLLIYKNATTVPLIADKGTGVAGSGRLFAVQLRVGDQTHDLSTLAMTAEPLRKEGDEEVLRMTANLAAISPGLWLERVFRMGSNESGIRIRDTFHNDGASDIAVRLGTSSYQRPEAWRLNLPCAFGDTQRFFPSATPYFAGDPVTYQAPSPQLFWRLVGQYGQGLLYQATAPQAPVELVHHLPRENGCPVKFGWLSSPVTLAAGEATLIESAVLIDEGGRQGASPASLASADRVVVMADLCWAGRSSEVLRGFGSVVSAVPRKVKMVASQYYHSEKEEITRVKVAEAELSLEPGKAAFRPFEFRPHQAGLLYIDIAVFDQGKKLADTYARAVIDGEKATGEFGQIWQRYVGTLPEVHARGTWEQIGEQLVKSGSPGPMRPHEANAQAAARLGFYEKHFPYYAEFLQGAARALQVKPEQLAAHNPQQAGPREACMGVFFNGPDGPINAYSKERSDSGLRGLGYVKVLPDQGYSYHMYTLGDWSFGYGVNSEGLCTSGATINCDLRTEEAGNKVTQERKQAGKPVAPLGTHMMLAMCKNVDEAIAFITNPDAPFEFTGNMLLVDRSGNAAILESVGVLHQIHRFDGKGVFATGNYPHERNDGLFRCGSNWGWAANTMLREKFLERILAEKKGRVSLKDAFWIMDTHALPGGMCQHGWENPGQLHTSTSYLAIARTGELFLSHGPPCRVHYKRYTLKEGE